MMSNIKKILFFVLANIFLILLIEIILTFFFVVHKSNYYGPLARIFLFEKVSPQKTVVYKIKYSKRTGMHIPGEYKFNNVTHYVNKFGFIGKEIDIENKTGCRFIALGGSTTAGIESKSSYPKILENLLNKKNYNCQVLNFGFSGKALNFLEKLLVNEASKFNPNFVILMNNRNSTMYDSYITSSVASDVIDNRIDLFFYEINLRLFFDNLRYVQDSYICHY